MRYVELGIAVSYLEFLSLLHGEDSRGVTTSGIVKNIFLLRISCRLAWPSLYENNDVFKRAVRADEVGLVRQVLAAIVLIFADFNGAAFWAARR